MNLHHSAIIALAVLFCGCSSKETTAVESAVDTTAAESTAEVESTAVSENALDTAAAESAVAGFHAHFDAEDYEAIYAGAHADFRAAIEKEELLAIFEGKRAKLGRVQATSLVGSHGKEGNGNQLVLTYTTNFENGDRKEVFIYGVEGEGTALVGWHLG
ncbi:MAG: hypothetical protein QGG40_13870, partial [Myxococcota bacterium]|nr:hypothetical protein [Myxococcota bacterium]